MKHLSLRAGFLLAALFGGLLGFFAKLGDVAATGHPAGSLLYAFGLVSSGVLLWMTVCTALSLSARCGLHASLLVLAFLIPMLICYYLFSRFGVGYYNGSVVRFWVWMLIPSAIAAWVLRANRRKTWLRAAAYAAAFLTFAYDLLFHMGGSLLACTMEFALFLCFVCIMRRTAQEKYAVQRAQTVRS